MNPPHPSSRSIAWELPLIIGGLVLAVTFALSFAAWRELRRDTLSGAEQRLRNVGDVYRTLLTSQAGVVTARARIVAGTPAFAAAASAAPSRRAALAAAAFAAAPAQGASVVARELWTPHGEVLAAEGPEAARVAGLIDAGTRRGLIRDSAAFSAFFALGDTAAYAAIAPIRVADSTAGAYVEWRRLASSGAVRGQMARLVGHGGRLLLGSDAGVWSDQVTVQPAPPSSAPGTLLRYVSPPAGPAVAFADTIPGTPWRVVIEFPEAEVLAPVRRLTQRMGVIALVVLAVVLGVGLALSRRIALAFDRIAAHAREESAARDAAQLEWRELFESNPHPMWVYSRETQRFLAVNEAAVRRYGWTREEFATMKITDIRPPEEVPQFLEHLRDLPPVVDYAGEWRHRTRNGVVLEVTITSHAITFAGQPARLVQAQDMSARRALEAQVRQGQKMEAVGRLAGGVAHDFNNLLTVIMSHTELMRAQTAEGDPRLEDLDMIAETSRRAHAVTRQLLAFSRRQTLRPELLSPDDVVREVGHMLRPVIGEDIDLHLDLGAEGGAILVDKSQVEQVLLNLAINARDAMPVGGRLTIATTVIELDDEGARVHGVPKAGRYAQLSVTDTGVGMTETVRARIFEPFFTTKDETKGTGLGLASVYGIVTQSGGGVTVYSEPGRGSVFRVHLPCMDDAPVKSSAGERAVPPSRGRETILLAEDDAAVRHVTREILQRFGYTVIAAASGEEALAMATRAGDVNLVVSDVVMPGMDGPTLVRRLREMRPGLKAMFVSGYAGDEMSHRGVVEAGAPLLEKPFTAFDLARKVREVIDGPGATTWRR